MRTFKANTTDEEGDALPGTAKMPRVSRQRAPSSRASQTKSEMSRRGFSHCLRFPKPTLSATFDSLKKPKPTCFVGLSCVHGYVELRVHWGSQTW